MLLITMLLPPGYAVELTLHLWYSARLTSDIVRSLEKTIKPLIEEVVGRIANRADSMLQSKTWTFGTGSISAPLYKRQWSFLLAMLEKAINIEDTESSRKFVMLNDTRLDYRERKLFSLPPSRREVGIPPLLYQFLPPPAPHHPYRPKTRPHRSRPHSQYGLSRPRNDPERLRLSA